MARSDLAPAAASISCGPVLRELEVVFKEIDEAAAFFGPAALTVVVEWANRKQFAGLTFGVGPGELRIEDSGEHEMRVVTRPAALQAVERAPLGRIFASAGLR
jgi:hypothetical protein